MKSAERSPPRVMRHVILRMMTPHTRAGVSDPEVPQRQESDCDDRSRRRMELSPVGVRQWPVRPGPCQSQPEASTLQNIDLRQLSLGVTAVSGVASSVHHQCFVFCFRYSDSIQCRHGPGGWPGALSLATLHGSLHPLLGGSIILLLILDDHPLLSQSNFVTPDLVYITSSHSSSGWPLSCWLTTCTGGAATRRWSPARGTRASSTRWWGWPGQRPAWCPASPPWPRRRPSWRGSMRRRSRSRGWTSGSQTSKEKMLSQFKINELRWMKNLFINFLSFVLSGTKICVCWYPTFVHNNSHLICQMPDFQLEVIINSNWPDRRCLNGLMQFSSLNESCSKVWKIIALSLGRLHHSIWWFFVRLRNRSHIQPQIKVLLRNEIWEKCIVIFTRNHVFCQINFPCHYFKNIQNSYENKVWNTYSFARG